MPTRKGSIRLFSLFGINVYLHWSWIFAVIYFTSVNKGEYSSIVWNVYECLMLFLIVLMHEFGHSLACKSVGGRADQIVLWPLGGVAYVSPPQRPGATLWSLAAGPLVNVMLAPVLYLAIILSERLDWTHTAPDIYILTHAIYRINAVLLIFNLLPIYPLDGGQILRSLLWFVLGRANSLIVAAVIGFAGMAGLIALGAWEAITHGGGDYTWAAIMATFILLNCWAGLMHGLALAKIARAPRRAGFACPACQTPPPVGAFWRCHKCQHPFDTFETLAVCPNCQAQFNVTSCPECGALTPIRDWALNPPSHTSTF